MRYFVWYIKRTKAVIYTSSNGFFSGATLRHEWERYRGHLPSATLRAWSDWPVIVFIAKLLWEDTDPETYAVNRLHQVIGHQQTASASMWNIKYFAEPTCPIVLVSRSCVKRPASHSWQGDCQISCSLPVCETFKGTAFTTPKGSQSGHVFTIKIPHLNLYNCDSGMYYKGIKKACYFVAFLL